MGREIRLVKKGWEHPKDEGGVYHPMYDDCYEDELNEWIDNHYKWIKGEHEDQLNNELCRKYKYYEEWGGRAPNIEYYRKEKWTKDDEMWYQVYENVSEGTPLTPAFKTKKELAEYLINIGDSWDGKWTKEQAYGFIESEYCPSMIMDRSGVHKGKEIFDKKQGGKNE